MVTEADVLVIGAGPAGAGTAVALARHGLAVLLVDAGDDEATYDVLITAPALAALESLGVPTRWTASVAALELRSGAADAQVISEAGMAVGDRRTLRDILRRSAISAGVQAVSGAVRSLDHADGRRVAVVARTGGARTTVAARHVVVATGAEPAEAAPHARGVYRTQRFTGADLGSRVLLSIIDSGERPICVWALPGAPGTVTVGAASVGTDLIEAVRPAGLGTLIPAGPPVHGVLNTGFTVEQAMAADGLLVGDAAGLVNPFTGEGLSYALQSALLAAEAIVAHRADAGEAQREYAQRLARTFVGYFETARHASRRHRLMARILTDATGSDHPFFAKARRAVLLPEGLAGLTPAEPQMWDDADLLLAGPFLDACSEVAVVTIRREWPFLARLILTGDGLGHHRLRPARLFLAGMLAGGSPPDMKRATVAAALELATLGALAVLSPPRRPAGTSRGVDWALTSTVLASDFLLAQASRLVAEWAPEISRSFAEWLAELTTLRAARLDRPEDQSAGSVYASLFEYPARIGAVVGGCPDDVVRAVRDFGHHCGHAFLHAEDVLALRGLRTRLDTSLPTMLGSGTSALPDLLPGRTVTAELLREDPGLRASALKASSEECERRYRLALAAVATLEARIPRDMFRRFADVLAAPITTP